MGTTDMPVVGRQAPFRRAAGVAIVVVVVLVEVALLAAWIQLTGSRDALERADGLSIAFTDVQRQFQELEFLAATSDSVATEEFDTELDLLERQLQVAAVRLDDPATTPQLEGDIEAILTAFADLAELREADPADAATAQALADRGEAVAKAAVDRTATTTRSLFLADALAAERTSTAIAGVAGLLLVAGALLVWAVLTRYQRTFDEAWAVATERQQQLEASNARLATLAETRQRFVSVLSHELRTPLAIISAVGDTLSHHGDQLDATTKTGILRSLRRQVARQQRMIDDLLLVARHGNSDPEPSPTAVDVAALLTMVRHDEILDGMLATFEVEPGTVALADEHHLEQVVTNLVRNAEKYGGSRILVTARTEGDQVVLSVSDDGAGVPEDLRSTLFEPFTQGAEGKGGIGLGLSITRQLVEANGGEITYRDGEGGGAVFELRLPAASTVTA